MHIKTMVNRDVYVDVFLRAAYGTNPYDSRVRDMMRKNERLREFIGDIQRVIGIRMNYGPIDMRNLYNDQIINHIEGWEDRAKYILEDIIETRLSDLNPNLIDGIYFIPDTVGSDLLIKEIIHDMIRAYISTVRG